MLVLSEMLRTERQDIIPAPTELTFYQGKPKTANKIDALTTQLRNTRKEANMAERAEGSCFMQSGR